MCQFQMIRDRHQAARHKIVADAACGIGVQHRANAQR
jgi:hypothetical protein